MNKKIFSIILISLLSFQLLSCSEDDSPTPTPVTNNPPSSGDSTNTDTTTTDTVVGKTKTQMLAKKWIVDEAYVNGSTPDNSSKGLTLDVRSDGSYTLSTGYVGTWEFEANETKINWDKGTSFNQVFTLSVFTDTRIDATFVSAFTGQNARWIMIPN